MAEHHHEAVELRRSILSNFRIGRIVADVDGGFHPIALSLRGWRCFDPPKGSLLGRGKVFSGELANRFVGAGELMFIDEKGPQLLDVWWTVFGQDRFLRFPPMFDNLLEAELFDQRSLLTSVGRLAVRSPQMIPHGTFGDAKAFGDGLIGLVLFFQNLNSHNVFLAEFCHAAAPGPRNLEQTGWHVSGHPTVKGKPKTLPNPKSEKS